MKKIQYYFKKICIISFQYSGFTKLLRKISDWYEVRNNIKNVTPSLSAGWSIIIITDGNNNDCLNKCIESAERELKNSLYEIIVVGPPSLKISEDHDLKHISHLSYKELLLWSIPGLITRKKNLGASISKYDKLVFTHDYIVFNPGWKSGFDEFGDFTVCVNIMLNKDGTRHRDWMTWDHPEVGQALLPYEYSCNKYQYVNGAYFVVKREFYLKNLLDEKLRWGEGEDVEWSLRIREKTNISLNTKSVITYSKQKPSISTRWQENSKKLASILQK